MKSKCVLCNQVIDDEDIYTCPLCGEQMSEEEGLWWCDSCGINNHSPSYINAVGKAHPYVHQLVTSGDVQGRQSNKGEPTMSRTVKTLEQAVRDEIDAAVQNSTEFSAHDITTNIRQKINQGELEIDGKDFVTIAGVRTQYIEHADVRFMVHQHCGDVTCNIAGYERKWNPLQTGGYWSWSVIGTHVDDDDDDTDDDGICQPSMPNIQSQSVATTPPASIVQGMGGGGTGTVTASPSFQAADPSDPMVAAKVVTYFKNRAAKGQPGTLHTAQRRMKRNPLTIAQIKQIAKDNGFIVKSRPGVPECDSTVVMGAGQAFGSN